VQGRGQIRNSHRTHYQLEDSNATKPPRPFPQQQWRNSLQTCSNLFILRFNFVRNLFSTRQRFPSKYTKFSITHLDKQTKHIQPNFLLHFVNGVGRFHLSSFIRRVLNLSHKIVSQPKLCWEYRHLYSEAVLHAAAGDSAHLSTTSFNLSNP
jgi:hypothetical protein